jgi:phenylalanyl-tRNA synthetase beta chain
MKISLRWVFDHLKARMDDVSVEDLVSRFNKAVAEIEHVEKIEIDAFNLSLATCIKKAEKSVVLICKEWQKEIELPLRTDVSLNCSYLIKRSGSDFFWAQAADIGGDKEGLLPALVGDADWKKLLTDDYILHIENKSINHRPDLWCHRGIAREIGALYGFALIPEDELLAPIPKIEAPTKDIFQPAIATQYCTLFGLAYLPSVTVSDSLLFHAVRLIRCAVRPINFIVDLTNYVMLDMGHPMHAVDAEKIASKEIVVTHLPGKKIELLDGKTITLEPNDCVVASHGHPLSLAGIMGGRDASITKNTKSIIIIAEALNPSRIRLSSAFHKIRTEASVRFEKDLDPRGVFIALKRFVKLLPDLSKAPSAVLFAGKLPDAKKIILTLSLIQRSLGTAVSLEKAETVLRLYGFNVSHQTDGAETILTVDIPSWRATKDVSLADDIIEEVGRGIGYASIRPELPTRRMAPFNLLRVARQRALKRAAAQEGLHEVYTTH